ncbi:MAG: pyrimidine 5'-nucleotidase [Rhodospirillales bacterium]
MSPTEAAAGPRLDRIETWVFDLDNTLYRVSERMHAEIDRKIGAFLMEFLAVDAVEARRVQKAYFAEYGLTMRGLMVRHGLDPQAFLDATGLPDLSDVALDEGLAHAIGRLPGRKIIYTNSHAVHAERVLERIGMTDHFEVVHDIIAANYLPKPSAEAFAAICTTCGFDPARAAMFDDIIANLKPAAALGMTTVWVKTDAAWARDMTPGPEVHYVVENLKAWIEAAVDGR